MNYKHAYHAGNFADVVKHILLLELLQHFTKKPKPFYVLDAYGGRGLYSLDAQEAKKTQESALGIGAFLAHDHTQAPPSVALYDAMLKEARAFYDKHVYPGSPWWIARFCERYRTQEGKGLEFRAEVFEAQGDEYDALNYQLHQLPIGIHHRDAFEGIRAVIPPRERRGLILIDPPFEQEHKDFSRLVDLLQTLHIKWANGIFALWYPIKNPEAVALFYKKMKRLGIPRQMICTLNLYPDDIAMGLAGTGLFVINAPFGFDTRADAILRYLAPILTPKAVAPATYAVKHLVGERVKSPKGKDAL